MGTQIKARPLPKTKFYWIKTTRNSPKREIDPRQEICGYFWGFSNLWWKSQIGDESVATKSCWYHMMRVASGGWPDLHGFGGRVRGFEMREKNTTNTRMNTRGKSIQTHEHTPSGHSRGPESPTQIQSNHKKDTIGRILWRDQIASQMVELKEWRDQDY